MQKMYLYIGGAIVAVAIAGALVWHFVYPTAPTSDTATTTPMATSSVSITGDGAGYTVTQLPSYRGTPPPSLDHKTVFGPTVPADVQTKLAGMITTEQAALKKDPTVTNDWLQLGVLYHASNDYEAARDVWLFLEDALPTESTAVGNLGRLYALDLHDFPKAESYFKEALKRDPKDKNMYNELFDLYRYSYKTDTSAAVDIMKTAIAKFPEDPNFYLSLGLYYRTKGDLVNAKTILEKGLMVAQAAGATGVMNTINQELSQMAAQELK